MENCVIIAYGIFLLTGAFAGFKAGSRVSLVMGLLSAFVIFMSAHAMTHDRGSGLLMAGAVGALLSTVFACRYLKTRKFMPAGMLLGISLAFTAFCLYRILNFSL